MNAASAVKKLFGDIEKRNIVQATCLECNASFENYDLYKNGELITNVNDDICATCKRKIEDAEMVRNIMKQREERKYIKYYQFSVLPTDLDHAALDNYIPKTESQNDALKTIEEFISGSHEKTTMFFQGDTGVGKTHLSVSVFKEFEKNRKPAIFIDLPSLLASIRDTYSGRSDMTQDRIMQLIKDCELFVLDDIGAEYVKSDASGFESWTADILFQIVNARQGKQNIYTTNFKSKYLNEKYGMMSKRIISRLMNNAKVIKVDGKDHRLEGLD